MKVTILGSGGSKGVPFPGNYWGQANPECEKNKRTRSSLLLQFNGKKMLIDFGPDFRFHANKYDINQLDYIFVTHAHSDHIDGISDVMGLSQSCAKIFETYLSRQTFDILSQRFSVLLSQKTNPEAYDRLKFNVIDSDFFSTEIGGEEFRFFDVIHGRIMTTVIRVKNFAYVADFSKIPPQAIEALKGVETLVINANEGFHNYHPNCSHRGFNDVIELNKEIKAKRVILNHISYYTDYDRDQALLPQGFEIAYDGMELEI